MDPALPDWMSGRSECPPTQKATNLFNGFHFVDVAAIAEPLFNDLQPKTFNLEIGRLPTLAGVKRSAEECIFPSKQPRRLPNKSKTVNKAQPAPSKRVVSKSAITNYFKPKEVKSPPVSPYPKPAKSPRLRTEAPSSPSEEPQPTKDTVSKKCMKSPLDKLKDFHRRHNRKYREGVFAKIVESKKFEDYCICCGYSPVDRQHPFFCAGICAVCHDRLIDLPKKIDPRDGYQEMCTICTRGCTLSMCEGVSRGQKCIRSYCSDCLDLLLGKGAFEKVEKEDKWKCNLCRKEAFGLLQLRPSWKKKVEIFEKNAQKTNIIPENELPNSRLNTPVVSPNVKSEKISRPDVALDPSSEPEIQSNEVSTSNMVATPDMRETPLEDETEDMTLQEIFSLNRSPQVAATAAASSDIEQSPKPSGMPDEVPQMPHRIQNTTHESLELSPPISDSTNNNDVICAYRMEGVSPVEQKQHHRDHEEVTKSSHDDIIDDIGTVDEPPPEAARKSEVAPVWANPPRYDVRFGDVRSAEELSEKCICCARVGAIVTDSHPIFVGGVCRSCQPRVHRVLLAPLETAAAAASQSSPPPPPSAPINSANGDTTGVVTCCICCNDTQSQWSVLCGESVCDYGYCYTCISALVPGGQPFSALKANRHWSCFLCDDQQHYGLLKLRVV